ncbi:TIGR01777 family oxidoreductase [Povalibacter sp.]|uniref:TIGR01777 family oxidoreductase n=1 Tax=Povalibacter sp. TaxID=1962978 RepID=UPI002F41822B
MPETSPLLPRPSMGRTWLITGATGFIGSHLIKPLLRRGDRVIALARRPVHARRQLGAKVHVVASLDEVPAETVIDGIVNLAGECILGLPWTAARRRKLLASRIDTTRAIVELCHRLHPRPAVLVNGSAIGYYGVRGDEPLDENMPSQAMFQSRLCSEWEAAACAAAVDGVRVTCIRTGVVLSGDGGALPRLARPVRWYAGAILGTGHNWLSWIHIDDLIRLLLQTLDNGRYTGAINGTAPEPVRYEEFYRLLGRALHRPIWMHVPAAIIKAGLGEMSQLLLEGQRVIPRRAQELGFEFRYSTAARALSAIYGTA